MVCIRISPAGGIRGESWKSGYFTLAQQLDALVCVAGLDYSEQVLWVSSHQDKPFNLEVQQPGWQTQMAENIVPLHPYCSYPPCIKSYRRLSICGWPCYPLLRFCFCFGIGHIIGSGLLFIKPLVLSLVHYKS